MAQISRPFQIALVAVGLLACVWFIALRGHSSSASGSGSTPPESTAAQTHAASGPSAPGVAGLTKDVEKAHGAVKTSEQNATQLTQKSAEASSAAGGATSAPAGHAPAKAPTVTTHTTSKPAPATPGKAPSRTAAPSKPAGAARPAAAVASRQHSVEAQLAKGDIVLLLFWNPKGIDDRAVQRQVRAVAGSGVVVQQAISHEAAAFGTITRGVQLYSTPTVLVINGKGQAQVISGLTDAYALRQAVAEARKG
jgi:hypothetical protein